MRFSVDLTAPAHVVADPFIQSLLSGHTCEVRYERTSKLHLLLLSLSGLWRRVLWRLTPLTYAMNRGGGAIRRPFW